MKKIVILGGESTGKTTLSMDLANHYNCVFVEEYARNFLQGLNRPYMEDDLLHIAQGQLYNEREASQYVQDILICDTNLYVIKVWSEYKYGRCHEEILKALANDRTEAYILTKPDMPWEYDPLREHPTEQERRSLYLAYLDILSNQHKPFLIAEGTKEERVLKAIEFIEKLN